MTNDSVLGFEIDYTGGFDLSESFFLGINGAYQVSDDAGFYGAAFTHIRQHLTHFL